MSRVRLHHALLILAVSAGCERSDPITAPPRALAPHAAIGSTIIVTKTSDDGTPGTLRHAIGLATNDDIIQFDPTIAGQTITLNQEILLEGIRRTIEGPAVGGITISGGGVHRVFLLIFDGELTISNVTITGGQLAGGGAGITLSQSKLTMRNSTVSGNVAEFHGGGIVNFASTVTIINSTISGNRSDTNGGGIHTADGATTEIINSTISGNSAGGSGGGLSNEGTVKIRNTIVAGNTAANESGCTATPDALFELTGVNLSDSPSCAGFLIANPVLGPLANNGGPTKTHALLSGSQAINAATSCTVTEDQRHVARPQPAGGACDIGAYEFTDFLPSAVTLDGSSSINPNNGAAVITGSMTCPLSGPVTVTATLSQPQKKSRVSIVVTASAASVVVCNGTMPWAVLLLPINGAFTNGTGSATVTLRSVDPSILPSSADESVKLFWGHK